MKTAIIGGGIGGMAAAIALRLRGVSVELFEQADKFEEVGAGVQISPNGYHVLARLGVHAAIEDIAFEPESIQMRHGASGKMIVNIPIRQTARTRWGAPYLHMRRSSLHNVLLERARALGVEMHLSVRISLEEIDKLDADFIVAADGIHSKFRQKIFDAPPAKFSGKTAWRLVVGKDKLKFFPPLGATAWAEQNIHAVTTWIDGGQSVNFVGISECEWSETDWNGIADKGEVLELFSHFDPQVREVIAKSENIMKWALFEHEKLSSFAKDNIAFIGDAAHPMMPSLAQGAVMALEDAWMLAKCLCDDLTTNGLASYSASRVKRVTKVQNESLHNLNRFHRNGLHQWAEQNGAKALGILMPSFFIKRLDWLYGFDVTLD